MLHSRNLPGSLDNSHGIKHLVLLKEKYIGHLVASSV
jgi:hypothetical protein